MKCNPDIHHRKSIRLRGYDYSQAGLYFITVCTHSCLRLFGEIIDGEMVLNECGQIAVDEWIKTSVLRPNVKLDEFVIMPNHIHGIINIRNDTHGRGVLQYAPTKTPKFKSPSQTIGAIIRGYKSSVTKQINMLREMSGVPVWQRNYYEHIIRDEKSYHKISEYIINNPIHWQDDKYYE